MNRISETIKKLFPDDFEELIPVKRHWWQKIDWSYFKGGWRGWTVVLMLAVVVFSGIHYYNHFVILETQVLTDKAQIEAHLQRRKDLLINLTRTVIDYAEHERSMFKYMADTRADSLENKKALEEALKKGGILDETQLDAISLEESLAKLLAIAEAYPELKLSANFQKLMEALVNIEDRIVERRMAYNDSCNKYGTYIRRFPQNTYALILGFKRYPFLEVDKDVGLFNKVEY